MERPDIAGYRVTRTYRAGRMVHEELGTFADLDEAVALVDSIRNCRMVGGDRYGRYGCPEVIDLAILDPVYHEEGAQP